MINNKYHKVVFFGAGPYVSRIVETLKENFEVYVFTTETEQNQPVILYCSSKHIQCVSITKFDHKVVEYLEKIGARIAVLAYFGLIVPKDVLDFFELGIINVHPSLLPKYRGATPGQAAILNGDSVTGVSIIKLDEQVDHGAILAQVQEKIKPNDTSETLYERLFQKGAELLSKTLPKYISGDLKPSEQNHSKATFTERLTRESGFIDLSQKPIANSHPSTSLRASQLNRMIRAYHPWPGVWFRVNLKLKTENSKLQGKIIKLLPEGKIQVEGKNVMKLSDFANGYPEAEEIIKKLDF